MISDPNLLVDIFESRDSYLVERLDLGRLAHAIPVRIGPCAKLAKPRITFVNLAVLVAAELRSVQLFERSVSNFRRLSGREPSRIAEELAAVVDRAVVIPIPAEKSVVSACLCPGYLFCVSVGINVKADSLLGGPSNESHPTASPG